MKQQNILPLKIEEELIVQEFFYLLCYKTFCFSFIFFLAFDVETHSYVIWHREVKLLF